MIRNIKFALFGLIMIPLIPLVALVAALSMIGEFSYLMWQEMRKK